MKKIILWLVLRDIRRYFGFLLDMGYRISNARYIPEMAGYWIVQLESSECFIEIHSDRGDIDLVFMPVRGDRYSAIAIEPMIYFLSRGETLVGNFERNRTRRKQLERLANLLKEYLDQITPYFGNDFYTYKNDLLSAQKEYNDLFVERYTRNSRK